MRAWLRNWGLFDTQEGQDWWLLYKLGPVPVDLGGSLLRDLYVASHLSLMLVIKTSDNHSQQLWKLTVCSAHSKCLFHPCREPVWKVSL